MRLSKKIRLILGLSCGFASRPGNSKNHYLNGEHCLPAWHAGVRVGV